MENIYLQRALYSESTAKLEHIANMRTLEDDATWEDYLELQDIVDVDAGDAKQIMETFRFSDALSIHATGRLGQRAVPESPLREAATHRLHHLRAYVLPYSPDTTMQTFIHPLAQAYARVDSLEGISMAAALSPNAPEKLKTYAKAASVIGDSHSEASRDIALELQGMIPFLAQSIRAYNTVSSHSFDSQSYIGDILAGTFKRLYRDDPERILQQALGSGESALNLLKAIQQMGEAAPSELHDRVLAYSKQPEVSDKTRKHILSLLIKGGQYEQALEVPTGSIISKRLSSRQNPRKEARLLQLYAQGEFGRARKLISNSVDDGPDRAQLRDVLIDHGDIPALRKYNLTDNGYRKRVDEIEIHVRHGDIAAADQVVSEMPVNDTASGYLAIAKVLVEHAAPDSYTLTDLEGFCTAALIANRKTTSQMTCGWAHGNIFNKLFEQRRFEDASTFRHMVFQDSELTKKDIHTFHGQTSVDQSRLLLRQGAYGEAMHGDHVGIHGVVHTVALLGLVGALHAEVFRRTGQS